jgi:wobble nucleotide-excising tRNase
LDGIGETLRAVRESALALLDRKAAAPLERVDVDAPFVDAHAGFITLQQAGTVYNQTVVGANAVIAAKKKTPGAADVRTVEAALIRLRAVKTRCEAEARKACDEHALAKLEKTAIEENKAAVRRQLDEYTEQVIGRYQDTINNFLDGFNAGFRITGTKHRYPGGVASSSYQIFINNTAVDLGDSETPLDKPSFRNTLSSGDKSTLSLAFFLAQLAHDPNRAKKIVIFDDPFNSQDGFRQDCTVQKIRKCGQECTQVILLSHDPHFLKRVWERLQTFSGDRKMPQAGAHRRV